MTEDDDPDETAANLQMEMVDAARELIGEHGYSLDDVLSILRSTCS